MKKISLKTRILLCALMFLMVVSLAVAAIAPIRNALEKAKEEEKNEEAADKKDDNQNQEDDETEEGYY